MEQTLEASRIKEYGYDTVPIANALVGKLDALDDLWKQFLAQPEEVKNCHVFAGGAGYEAKGPTSRDYKENFHVKLGYVLPSGHTELDARFVEMSKRIIKYSTPAVRLVMDAIKQQTGFDLGPMVFDSTDQWVLRALWYPPREIDLAKSAVVAEEHLDKGITLHLRESDSGFELFWRGKWVAVPHQKGRGIFMLVCLGSSTQSAQ